MARKPVISGMLRRTAIAAIGCCMSLSAMAAGYVATVLPTLGGTGTRPYGIDNSGGVTGESNTGQARHAFYWNNGTMTDLGGVGAATVAWGKESNPAGEVTGNVFSGDSSYAFVHSGGTMKALLVGYGRGINAAGDVVGGSRDYGAFLYRDGVLSYLGTFGRETSTAEAINNAGTIVGTVSDYSGASPRAFVLKNGVVTIIEPLAGNLSKAVDINDAGVVLGFTTIPTDPNIQHVFIWKDGVMTDTGIPVGNTAQQSTHAINSAGQVLTREGVLINSVFTPVADMLPPELAVGEHDGYSWMFASLSSINDAGQVVGSINKIDFNTGTTTVVGFVLTPAATCSI